MKVAIRNINPFSATVQEIIASIAPLLRYLFPLYLLVVTGLLVYSYNDAPASVMLAALAIIAVVTVPMALWTSGRVGGLPAVPALCAAEIIWFALPIVRYGNDLRIYDGAAIWRAAVLEISFLVPLIAIWYAMARKPAPQPRQLRMIPAQAIRPEKLGVLWLAVFAFGVAFTFSVAARWTDPLIARLPAGTYPLLRTFATTGTMAAAFFLGMATGMKRLSPGGRMLFAGLFLVFWLAACRSLLLISVVPVLLPLLAGMLLGSGRLPWRTLVLSFLVLQVLHAGKATMRDRYWSYVDGSIVHVAPVQWPAFYVEWWGAGMRGLFDPIPGSGDVELLSRTSIAQMVLFAQERAPSQVPFMDGETLWLVPKLFVPRIIWAGKPRTHEGQVRLNIHFNRQDEESAERIYIAWGMLAEFYANFGMLGGLALGGCLGGLLGFMTRHTTNVPTTSLRFLAAVPLFIGSITATQMAVSTWATAMFQSIVAICLIGFVIMRKRPVKQVQAEPPVMPASEAT